MDAITVLVVVMCSVVGVHGVPAKNPGKEKGEKFTADFGEKYNSEDYDVVYNMSQSNKLINVRTSGKNPQLTIMIPDSTSILYQGPLKLPSKQTCLELFERLQIIFGDFFSRRRDGKLIVTPSEEECVDYIDMMENREMNKNDYRSDRPQIKRSRRKSQSLLRKLLSMRNRK